MNELDPITGLTEDPKKKAALLQYQQTGKLDSYFGEPDFQRMLPTPESIGLTPEELSTMPQRGDLTSTEMIDARAHQQSTWDKWGNAAGKAGVQGVSTILDTFLGTATGVGNVIKDGADPNESAGFNDFIDNPFSRTMSDWNKWAEEALPNYRSTEEANNPWYKNMDTANFWADGVLKNLGFAAGAAVSGMMVGGALSGLTAKAAGKIAQGLVGSIATDGKVITTLAEAQKAIQEGRAVVNAEQSGAKIAKEVEEAARKIKSLDAKSQITASAVGSIGESRFEALNAMDEYETKIRQAMEANPEQYANWTEADIQSAKESLGNGVFALNAAILGVSNYSQFKNLYKPKTLDALNAVKSVDGNIIDGYRSTAKGLSKLDYAAAAVKNPLSEGTEELLQYSSSEGLKDLYLKKKSDGDLTSFLSNTVEGFKEGTKKAVGTAEGWENFVVGALIGGMGVPVPSLKTGVTLAGGIYSDIKDLKESNKNEVMQSKVTANALNDIINRPGFRDQYYHAVRNMALGKDADAAFKAGNLFEFKNKESDIFLNDTLAFIKAGKIQDLVDYFDGSKSVSAKELRGLMTVSKDPNTGAVLEKPIEVSGSMTDEEILSRNSKRAEGFKGAALRIRDIHNQVGYKYPKMPQQYKDLMTNLLYSAEDTDKRIVELQQEINNKSRGLVDTNIAPDNIQKSIDEFNEKLKTSLTHLENKESYEDLLNLVGRKQDLIDTYLQLNTTKGQEEVKDTLNKEDKKAEKEAEKEKAKAEHRKKREASQQEPPKNQPTPPAQNTEDEVADINGDLWGDDFGYDEDETDGETIDPNKDNNEPADKSELGNFDFSLDAPNELEEFENKSKELVRVIRKAFPNISLKTISIKKLFNDVKAVMDEYDERKLQSKEKQVQLAGMLNGILSTLKNVNPTEYNSLIDDITLESKITSTPKPVTSNNGFNDVTADVIKALKNFNKDKRDSNKLASTLSIANKTTEYNHETERTQMSPEGAIVFNKSQDSVVYTSDYTKGLEVTFKVLDPKIDDNGKPDVEHAVITISAGDRMLGYVHDISYVTYKNVNADTAQELELERNKLLSLRQNIINGNTKGVISETFSGYINKPDAPSSVSTLLKNDPNLKLGIVSNGQVVFSTSPNVPMLNANFTSILSRNGATVISVPHPDGYYIPWLAINKQIKHMPELRMAMYKKLLGYLQGGSADKPFFDKYMFVHKDSLWFDKDESGKRFIIFQNKRFTLDGSRGSTSATDENVSNSLISLIGNTIFNVKAELLKSDKDYYNEILELDPFTTRLQSQESIKLDKTKEITYFHQRTAQFELVGENVQPMGDPQTVAEQELNKEQDNNDDLPDFLQDYVEQYSLDSPDEEVSSELLVDPRLSYEVQRSAIQSIAHFYLQYQDYNDYEDPDFNVADKFTKERDLYEYLDYQLQKFQPALSKLTGTNLTKVQSLVDNYKIILSEAVFPKLEKKAKEFIEELGYTENQEGIYENLEAEEDSINQMFDTAAAFENRKETATKEFKKFLYFIPEYLPDGKEKKNILNLPQFADYDTLFKTIAIELTGMVFTASEADIDTMIIKLEKNANPTVKQVAKKLKDTRSILVRNSFYSTFDQQYALYKTLLTSTFFGQNLNTNARVINSDEAYAMGDAVEKLQNLYNRGFEASKVDVDATGQKTLYVDYDKAKVLEERLLELSKSDFDTIEGSKGRIKVVSDEVALEVSDILSQVGINIHPLAVLNYLNTYRTDDGRRGANFGLEIGLVNKLFKSSLTRDVKGANEVSYGLRNPFEHAKGDIRKLVYFEYQIAKQHLSPSFRSGGKQYYSIIRHNPLSILFNKFKNIDPETGINNFITDKKTIDTFAKYGLYPELLERDNTQQAKEFITDFSLTYDRGMKNTTDVNGETVDITEAIVKQYTLNSIWSYQNQGQRQAFFFSDTHSDKSMKVKFGATRQAVKGYGGNINDGTVTLPKNISDITYRYFKAEYDRIVLVQKQAKELASEKLIPSYHPTSKVVENETIWDYSKGGSLFYIYDFLNKDRIEGNFAAELYNDDGSINDTLSPEAELKIKGLIEAHFNKLLKANKADWAKLNLNDKFETIFDQKYLTKVLDIFGAKSDALHSSSKEFKDKILDYTIIDYVLNNVINSNEMLMLTGDPAQQFKGDNEDSSSLAQVKSTLNNVSKRNARLLAPGNRGAFKSKTYTVAYLKDLHADTSKEDLDFYTSILNTEYGIVAKKYGEANETDAQELTTVKEHLEVLRAYGKITNEQFEGLWYILDNDHYKKEFKDKEPKLKIPQKDALNFVLQAMKPVQVSDKIDNDLLISKQTYIKSSAFPLIPSIISRNPAMVKLHKEMMDKDIDRVAFESAVKIGLQNKGNLYSKGDIFPKGGVQVLNREHFLIQLDVPYSVSKDKVREGTQLSKLLFLDIPDSLEINKGEFKGKKVEELKRLYHNLHQTLYNKAKKELYDELGGITENLDGSLNNIDYNKLSKMLIAEGESRGYSLNTILGLHTNNNEFNTPLSFLPNSAQIEPVLTSLLTNRLSRNKITGKSYVQGSQVIFKYRTNDVKTFEDLNSKVKSSIVYTDPKYKNKTKLDFITSESGGTAEILLPFYFIDKKGNRVNVKQFIKDGILDTSKIDPKLLEVNGFRIPTQGHNSAIWLKVVGFLPEQAGDLVIVPSEIAGQMGSDYDVDKLYIYQYPYQMENGKLIPYNYEDKKIEELSEKELHTMMMDIHKAILTAPEVLPYILNPLSTDDLEDNIKKIKGATPEWLGNHSTLYQRQTYFDNMGGKKGVGITANANTAHSMSQSANLFIEGTGVLFLDELGNPYKENVRDNRVTEYHPNQYRYLIGDNENGYMDNSEYAWRLDKVKTFDGRRISDVISEWLGASVDNAKDKLLGLGNINKHNFNASMLIVRTGFGNNWVIPFINQPILKEFYNLKDKFDDDSETKYNSYAAQQRAIEEFKKTYLLKYYTEQEANGILADIEKEKSVNLMFGFKNSDLYDMLKESPAYAIEQIKVLESFLHYENIASQLFQIQQAFNTDTKGYGKSILDMYDRGKNVASVNKKTPNIGNLRNYKRLSLPDIYNAGYKIGVQLFSKLFIYETPAVKSMFTRLYHLTGKNELNLEKQEKIYDNLIQYLYSNNQFNIGVTNVSDTKNKLVYGETSLAERVLNIQNILPNSFFVQRLTFKFDQNPDNPKLLTFNNTTNETESFDERISEEWLSLLQHPNPEVREFFQDLGKYALLVQNGKFGASNLIKYLPEQYLRTVNFSNVVKSFNFNDEDLLNGFIEQFLQHHPEFTKASNEKYIARKGNHENAPLNKMMNVIKQDGVETTGSIIEAFGVPPIDQVLKTKKGAYNLLMSDPSDPESHTYIPYVTLWHGKQHGRILYKLHNVNGNWSYIRVDNLGMTNFNEYNREIRNHVKSSIPKNKSGGYSRTESIIVHKPKVITNFDKYLKGPNTTGNILSRIVTHNINSKDQMLKYYGKLAQHLFEESSSNVLEKEVILNDKNNAKFTFRASTREVTLATNEFLKTTNHEFVVRNTMHEFLHQLTEEQLSNPDFFQTPKGKRLKEIHQSFIKQLNELKDNNGKVRMKFIEGKYYTEMSIKRLLYDQIYKVAVAENLSNSKQAYDFLLSEEGIPYLKEAAKSLKLPVINDDVISAFKEILLSLNLDREGNSLYASISIKEFITETMTSKSVITLLKSMEGDGKSTLFDKLIAWILDLFDAPKNSLYADALSAIMDITEKKEVIIKAAKEEFQKLKKINIQMQPDNIQKILNGTKTSTIRTESQKKQINLEIGESGVINFNNKEFIITNIGFKTIQEVGKKNILNSEGLSSENEFKFPTSKNWFDGKGRMYIYKIEELKIEVKEEVKPIEEPIIPTSETDPTDLGDVGGYEEEDDQDSDIYNDDNFSLDDATTCEGKF